MAQYCKELLLELLKQMVMMIFLDPPSNTHPLYPLYKTLIAKALHAHDDQTRQTHLQYKGALLRSSLVEDKFEENAETTTCRITLKKYRIASDCVS